MLPTRHSMWNGPSCSPMIKDSSRYMIQWAVTTVPAPDIAAGSVLHELMVGTDLIKKNIQEHARVAEMFATALNDGMRTLKQDGIEKVLSGITDIHQVRAVCIK